jgi:hypothetical protein
MSDTNRYMTQRRPPLSAPPVHLSAGVTITPPSRIEALRCLVAAGQYQVSPRWLATKILQAAGVKLPR